MKFKTAREAYADLELSKTIKEIENEGLNYNYFVANHFSLQEYVKKNNISLEDAFNHNVICRVSIFKDETNKHLRDTVKEEGINTAVITEEIHLGGKHKKLILKDGDRRSIPLLYLLTKVFTLHKELIFNTRISEVEYDRQSSSSIKKIRRKENLFSDNLHDTINTDLFCKPRVLLIPIINANGSPVEWHIPISNNIDENRYNALRMYNTQFSNIKEEINKEDVVFSKSLSDEDIRKLIKQNAKKNND